MWLCPFFAYENRHSVVFRFGVCRVAGTAADCPSRSVEEGDDGKDDGKEARGHFKNRVEDPV